MNFKQAIAFISFFLISFVVSSQSKTFTNPLLPSGADPWSIYKDGNYYFTQTFGDRSEIYKTTNIADLKSAPHKTIFKPAETGRLKKIIALMKQPFLKSNCLFDKY